MQTCTQWTYRRWLKPRQEPQLIDQILELPRRVSPHARAAETVVLEMIGSTTESLVSANIHTMSLGYHPAVHAKTDLGDIMKTTLT